MFKVGDRVSLNKTDFLGTVVKITDKRKDVVVQFDTGYKETFREDGRKKNDNVWYRNYIYPLTEELVKKIEDDKVIAKCRVALEKFRPTADQARRILRVMNGDGVWHVLLKNPTDLPKPEQSVAVTVDMNGKRIEYNNIIYEDGSLTAGKSSFLWNSLLADEDEWVKPDKIIEKGWYVLCISAPPEKLEPDEVVVAWRDMITPYEGD